MSDLPLLPSESIRNLVETLRAIGMEFAIVGGVAVSMVATPRFTADIDAVVLDVDDRLEWLLGRLTEFGYLPRTPDLVTFARRTRVLVLKDANGIGVDLMMGLLPFDIELVNESRSLAIADDLSIPVATPEHLVVMKAIAWRPKDQEDIRQLVAMNPLLDRIWINRTFAEYAELLDTPERVEELIRMMN